MSTNNPLLAKLKLPGRTFQLPSRGALYNNGEIEGEDGEIHVHAMSAFDEITLKNSDLLFNGSALDDVAKACIPQLKKPSELYGRDIDAIMIFLRLVTYGPEFPIKVTHNCEKAKEHEYVVNIEEIVASMVYLDPTDVESKYVVTLDNGQVVKVRPTRYKDVIKLLQDNLKFKNANVEPTTEEIKKTILASLITVIESVDGITDEKMISEWAAMLTTPQQNRIAEAVANTNAWGPNNTTKLKCCDCGEEFEVELPLNPISFFTE